MIRSHLRYKEQYGQSNAHKWSMRHRQLINKGVENFSIASVFLFIERTHQKHAMQSLATPTDITQNPISTDPLIRVQPNKRQKIKD
jgi:hypothetical protein